MTLAGGGAVAWGLGAAPSHSGIPQWPTFVFAVVAVIGFYGLLAPLLRWWPWLEEDSPDPITALGSAPSTGSLTALAVTAPVVAERPATRAPQLIFEKAPPELANLSRDSLKALFAGRTEAQGRALMKQHVGKPVRVFGEVEDVKLTGTPRVDLRSAVALLLFFDADDYDPGPVLLSLHIGDKIVVSGQIHEFTEAVVFLDQCRLIETRGRVS